MSCRPARTASSTTYWIAGLSTSGSISLDWALVAGRKRVPHDRGGNRDGGEGDQRDPGRGRHTLAAASPAAHRDAVADNRGGAAREQARASKESVTDAGGDQPLEDVAQQHHEGGPPAE